ncbi:beta-phosphoglucomutase family hydrolase [Agromyces terreus]|uniref:Beta-phosphoglucomutase n=1 Tax=Agromyces terreus TaxID=424795 RepID=A0A9X2H0I3_9MICO|nr:beta-phosphoglucomutase family hydrolase [Agromyces terreus]MCP2370323.1 beta-phosphoglucomutase family hydrolase [Agromyces terreus]
MTTHNTPDASAISATPNPSPRHDANADPDPADVDLRGIRGWLFDLDGVLTPTAIVHMHAWSRLFTPFLAEHGAAPYVEADYFAYIDGKPRYDGVRSLLESRGIRIPEGEVADGPARETVHGLGNRKNDAFNQTLEDEGVQPYPASVAFLDAVIASGCRVAVVSSSKNAPSVLAAAGIADRFEVVVDGLVAARDGIAGKPAPDMFEHAAELLGLPTTACAVVEDAESGIRAGAAGDFGLVVGVDRGVGREALRELGAEVIVDELDELLPAVISARSAARPAEDGPAARAGGEAAVSRSADEPPAPPAPPEPHARNEPREDHA